MRAVRTTVSALCAREEKKRLAATRDAAEAIGSVLEAEHGTADIAAVPVPIAAAAFLLLFLLFLALAAAARSDAAPADAVGSSGSGGGAVALHIALSGRPARGVGATLSLKPHSNGRRSSPLVGRRGAGDQTLPGGVQPTQGTALPLRW